MTLFFLVVSGCAGAVWASFLVTLAGRYPHALTQWWHRSRCESCMVPVHGLLLTPIASFIVLRGKCVSCKKPISPIHLVAECAGALLGVLIGAFFLMNAHVVSGLSMGILLATVSCLLYGACVDARLHVLPDAVTIGAGTVLVVVSLILGYSPWFVLGGVAVVSGFLGLQYIISQGKWIGLGDVKFGVLIGAFLGPWGGLWALIIAYITGALYGATLLLTHRARLHTQVPLGVFLAIGTCVSLALFPLLSQVVFGI